MIGFVVNGFAAYEILDRPPECPTVRFDVPVLGLEQATPLEIIVSARATFGAGDCPTSSLRPGGELAGSGGGGGAWRVCSTTGNLKAHFGLGYTLWELGRFQEAYRHLRFYTELTPRNSWAWCWLGKACVSLGLDAEARAAFERAIELEEAGSFETDADELLAALHG